MNTDPKVEQIFTDMAELRQAADGPPTRKILDALFRNVHNLKANASANGLNSLAAAAHEFENVLHSMRTGAADDLTERSRFRLTCGVHLRQEQKHTVQQSTRRRREAFSGAGKF